MRLLTLVLLVLASLACNCGSESTPQAEVQNESYDGSADVNNTTVRGESRVLFSWSGQIAGGIAASGAIGQILNVSYNNNGSINADWPYLNVLVRRIEMTLTSAVPTDVCLMTPDVQGTYSRAYYFRNIGLTNVPYSPFYTTYPAFFADQWSVQPGPIGTVNSFAKQIGHLENKGDKLIWEWPEETPLVLDYNTNNCAATIYNCGAGVSGALSIFALVEAQMATPSTTTF